MAKPKKPDPIIRKVNPVAWMLTFSDLLTLMLCFFVLLFSMSSLDSQKFQGAFGMLTGAFGVLGKTTEAELTPDPFQGLMAPVPEFLVRDIEDMIQRHLREAPEKVHKAPKIRPVPDEYDPLFKVERVDDGVDVRIAAEILFDKSGWKLSPWSVLLLKEVAGEIAEWGVPVRIDSYVSPSNSNRDAAWDLSIYRASAVTELISSEPGIDIKLLSMMGYGRPAPRRLQLDGKDSLVRVRFFTNERDAAYERAKVVKEEEVN